MKITTESHLDHELSPAVIDFIASRFANRDAFFIETVELPAELGLVPCNLHGPAVNELPVEDTESFYEKRGDRPWQSRMCNRAVAMVNKVTVIAGPHEGQPCILYTAYSGPLAPREPGNPELIKLMDTDLAKYEEAIAFWTKHALGKQ